MRIIIRRDAWDLEQQVDLAHHSTIMSIMTGFLSQLALEEWTCRLHLIDFEQLKIENQTVNEKIEERNEELLKLRRKNTSTVQVILRIMGMVD